MVNFFREKVKMTSNHYDNRNPSGFYTLLEDEMFGVGKTNPILWAGPAHRMTNSTSIIRRYGSIWEDFLGSKVRMFLYEPIEIDSEFRQLSDLDKQIAELLKSHNSLPNPKLQHNFAEDSGIVRDQIVVWESDELFKLNPDIVCNKLIKVLHFSPNSYTAFDFHVRIN